MELDKFDNVYIFTDSDLDGTGCRILFEYLSSELNKKFIIEHSSIGEIESRFEEKNKKTFDDFIRSLSKNDVVIFSDLVPENESIRKIRRISNIIICDHHKTTRDGLGEFDGYFYDVTKSSCKIVYDTFIKEKYDNEVAKGLAELVNIYDLWKDSDKNWKDAYGLNLLLWSSIGKDFSFGKNRFVSKQLRKFELFDEFKFLDSEKELIKGELEKEEEAYEEVSKKYEIRKDNSGNSYIYFKHGRKISSVASRLLKENKECSYVLARNTFKKNILKFSLRSRNTEDFYVLKMAESYGGGGHNYAAGFTISDSDLHDAIDSGEKHII